MFRVKKAVAAVAVVGGLFCAHASAWLNVSPSYRGLATDGSKFVAVSADGLIGVSDDGQNWSQNFVGARHLYSVAYGGEKFVVTADRAGAFVSDDGAQNWRPEATGMTSVCRYLVAGIVGNKLIFAGVGDGARTFVYDDWGGGDWDWDTRNYPGSQSLNHVAFGSGRFVAVGGNIMGSTSALEWGVAGSASSNLGAVAYNGETFVALSVSGNTAYTSETGANNTWTSASANAPAGMVDMTFGAGRFVAVGGNSAAYSTNGTQWNASQTLAEGDSLIAVKYGNGMFMALGANGSVYTSTNGDTWEQRVGGRFITYNQIVFGGGIFVAVGDSGISSSADGKNWIVRNAGKGLRGVAYGASAFAAVGDNGAIFVSSNGIDWEDKSQGQSMFSAVAFGNDRFVAVGRTEAGTQGQAFMSVSADGGQNWTGLSPGTGSSGLNWDNHATVFPTSIASDGSVFVAGASNGSLRYSGGNPSYWNESATSAQTGSSNIASVTYSEGKFIALGTSGAGTGASAAIITSTDGTVSSWTRMPVTGLPVAARAATFAKGFYIVAADSGYVYGSSNDGETWAQLGRVTNRGLHTVYSGNDIILAAGANGAMLYLSETPISIRYAARPSGRNSPGYGMRIENAGRAPMITLSFTPEKAGTIAVYSLTGRQVYRANVNAGQRSIQLPRRLSSSGSVVVRYTGGDGTTVVNRFRMVR